MTHLTEARPSQKSKEDGTSHGSEASAAALPLRGGRSGGKSGRSHGTDRLKVKHYRFFNVKTKSN